MRPHPFAVALAAVTLGGPATAQTLSAPLRLPEVLDLSRERSPRIHALSAAAEAAAYRAPEASTLPDPMLQIGIMNFGVPDLNTDMPMSMAPSVQLMQTLPFPGKLSLGGEIASLTYGMAQQSAEEARWSERARVSGLFYELYAIDRRTEVMRETLALLQDFQKVAKAMYSAGTGRQADALRADVEVARMDGEIRQIVQRRVATAARLNAALDLPVSDTVPSPALEPLPIDAPTAEVLTGWARESRPMLSQARLGAEQARSRSALAGRRIWPDFTVGLSYGQRDRGLGTERMASAMLGFSLPIHAGSRQYAERDEAAAMERLADAELQGREAEVDARIAELLAELSRTGSLAVLYRDEVIPEARATVESAFSSYRVGNVDFMTLVDAQIMVNRYEGDLYTLLADYGKAFTALEATVGRELPRSGPMLTEER